MRFSPSSLSSFSKCGWRYRLEKIEGIKEPGKKGYSMLQGDVVGLAIQNGCLVLNTTSSINDDSIKSCLAEAYAHCLTDAGIESDLIDCIRGVVLDGYDEGQLLQIDNLAFLINCSEKYEFNPPKALKSGAISKNKKTPPLSMKVLRTLEDLYWFFEPHHKHYQLIRDALLVENEFQFEYPIGGEYDIAVNDKMIKEQDYIGGRIDTLLTMPGVAKYALEYKYGATQFSSSFVNNSIQVTSYAHCIPGLAEACLVDVQNHNYFYTTITPEKSASLAMLYRNLRNAHTYDVFAPVCPTDPYTAKSIMCGFKKHGGCEFACKEYSILDEEGVDGT